MSKIQKLDTSGVFGAGSIQIGEGVKQMSRFKYGRPRDEVEKEIQERVASVIK